MPGAARVTASCQMMMSTVGIIFMIICMIIFMIMLVIIFNIKLMIMLVIIFLVNAPCQMMVTVSIIIPHIISAVRVHSFGRKFDFCALSGQKKQPAVCVLHINW